ncbi:MAG: 5-(carboxyamino)imidazole ribonucleotide synthase [Planctomycetes bacterium]|nr:5-(carboxyamino)imidazole ribonucleotide synthase [Planctomycetota bacterium]
MTATALVGVLGSGQLGRMLALAGYPLGLRFRFLDPAPHAPAAQVAECVEAAFDDPAALARFAGGLSVCTYEWENVPVTTARALEKMVAVYPPPQALEATQDRLIEKQFFKSLGILTAPFAGIEGEPGMKKALSTIGTPAILKTRRMGYDGKGQARINSAQEAADALASMKGAPCIVEGFVKFARELSVLAVRSRDGLIQFWPLAENLHEGGILRRTIAPAPNVPLELEKQARGFISRIMDALNYVGVMCLEMFQVGDQLLANEMATRVHNSGHWTIEGAHTSQFENHLRAVLGWPLGSCEARGASIMLNLIGESPAREAVLGIPEAKLHLYGKEPRPGRKLGHITVSGADAEHARTQFAKVCAACGSWASAYALKA